MITNSIGAYVPKLITTDYYSIIYVFLTVDTYVRNHGLTKRVRP